MAAFISIIQRELMLAMRNRADVLNPLIFLLIVVTLFPIGVGPEPNMLARMAPGVIWVAVLLSSMLGLERLFRDDYLDGTLEQFVLSPTPLTIIALAKVCSHWLLTGLPVLVLSPLIALLLNLPNESYIALMATLLVGTPLLSLVGAIGAALTVSLRKSSLLSSILILPLFIPILIFSTAALDAASLSLAYNGQIAWLAAMLILAIPLAPIAVAAAIKLNVN